MSCIPISVSLLPGSITLPGEEEWACAERLQVSLVLVGSSFVLTGSYFGLIAITSPQRSMHQIDKTTGSAREAVCVCVYFWGCACVHMHMAACTCVREWMSASLHRRQQKQPMLLSALGRSYSKNPPLDIQLDIISLCPSCSVMKCCSLLFCCTFTFPQLDSFHPY